MASETASTTLTIRLSPRERAEVERAAARAGRTAGTYVKTSALERARSDIGDDRPDDVIARLYPTLDAAIGAGTRLHGGLTAAEIDDRIAAARADRDPDLG